jgi:hypothetical protein
MALYLPIEDEFSPSHSIYDKRPTSSTSDSEFDLATRVHTTNEIPTVDIFESLHDVLKNNMWKWFTGWNQIVWDTPFNTDTLGEEHAVVDEETGKTVDTTLSIAKYVNGLRVKNYGPVPERSNVVLAEIDPATGKPPVGYVAVTEDRELMEWRVPEAPRYEVNGTLLPDFDLLLHEGYRYLDKLYPDHPDFLKILTKNEFDDELIDAAAFVDYALDPTIFDFIAKSHYQVDSTYNRSLSELDSSKLKIRNLLSNAFRRKLYGSKVGMRAFAADAGFSANPFTVGMYLPFKTHTNKEDEFVYDSYNRNYLRKFRLLDWDYESYKAPDEEESTRTTVFTTHEDASLMHSFDANFSEVFKPGSAVVINDVKQYVQTSTVAETWHTVNNKPDLVLYSSQVSKESTPLMISMFRAVSKNIELELESDTSFQSEYSSAPVSIVEVTFNPVRQHTLSLSIDESLKLYSTDEWTNTMLFMTRPSASFTTAFYVKGINKGHLRIASFADNNVFTNERNAYIEALTSGEINVIVSTPDGSVVIKGHIDESDIDYTSSLDVTTIRSITIHFDDIPTSKGLNEFLSTYSDSRSLLFSRFKVLYDELGSTSISSSPLSIYRALLTAQDALDRQLRKFEADFKESETSTDMLSMTTFDSQNSISSSVSKVSLTAAASIKAAYTPIAKAYNKPKETALVVIHEAFDKMTSIISGAVEINVNEFAFSNESKSLYAKLSPEALDRIRGFDNRISALLKNREILQIPVKRSNSKYRVESIFSIIENVEYPSNDNQVIRYTSVPTISQSVSSTLAIFHYGNLSVSQVLIDGKVDRTEFDKGNDYISTDVYKNQVQRYAKRVETQIYDAIFTGTTDIDDDPYQIAFPLDELTTISGLSVGDRITGSCVDSGTIINEIDPTIQSIFVDKPLIKSTSATFKATSSLKQPIDIENLYSFKSSLAESGIDVNYSPFETTLYSTSAFNWPFAVSSSELTSPVSSSRHLSIIENNNTEMTQQRVDYIRALYAENENDYVSMSSSFIDADVFYDVLCERIMYSKSGDELLMPIEILDYFDSNKSVFSKASDDVEVGAHIVIETDISGRVSYLESSPYTNPTIKLRAKTFNWTLTSVPTYVEVGTGDLFVDFEKEDEVALEDYIDKSYYAEGDNDEYTGSVYDNNSDEPIDVSLNVKDRNERRISDRGIFSTNVESQEDFKLTTIDHVDIPIFESPLGEYEYTPLFTKSARLYSLVNFSSRRDKIINVRTETTSSISSSTLSSYEIFQPISSEAHISRGTVLVADEYKDDNFSIDENGEAIVTLAPVDAKVRSETTSCSYMGEFKFVVDENGQIVWPNGDILNPDPDTMYYYIVTEDVNLSMYKDQVTQQYGLFVPRMSVIVRYGTEDTVKNVWTIRSMTYGGLYTGSKQFMSSFESNVQLTMPTVFPAAQQSSISGADPSKGEGTILSCLTRKIAVNASIAAGKSSPPLQWNGSTSTQVHFAKALYDSGVSLDNSIFWFILVDVPYDEDTKKQDLSEFATVGFYSGAAFAAVFLGDQFYIFEVNTQTKQYLYIPIEMSSVVTEDEITVSLGEQATKSISGDVLPIEKANQFITSISLPRSHIVPGTSSADITLDMGFVAKGFIDPDEDPLTLYNIYVSRGPLKLDMTRNLFYVDTVLVNDSHNLELFVGEEEKARFLNVLCKVPARYYVYQEQNKFYKNVLFLYGRYKNALDEISLKPIPGVVFESNMLSTSDELLSIEEIKLRSEYSSDLESVLFSSYSNITGILRGFYRKGTNGTPWTNINQSDAIISYRPKKGPARISAKLAMSTMLQQLIPIDDNDAWFIENGEIVYDERFGPLSGFGTAPFEAPQVSSIIAEEDITSVTEEDGFKYYKNTLVIEGLVNLNDLSTIDFSQSSLSTNGMTMLRPRDQLIALATLDLSSAASITEYGTPNIIATAVGFKRDSLVQIAPATGKVRVTKTTSVHPVIPTDVIDIDDTTKTGLENNATITGLAYDELTDTWVYSFNNDVGSFMKQFTPSTPTVEVNPFGETDGVDVPTNDDIKLLDVDAYYTSFWTEISEDGIKVNADGIEDDNGEEIVAPGACFLVHANDDPNTYARVKARDMAFVNINVETEVKASLSDSNEWIRSSVNQDGTFDLSTLVKDNDTTLKIDIANVTTNASATTKDSITVTYGDPLVVSFAVSRREHYEVNSIAQDPLPFTKSSLSLSVVADAGDDAVMMRFDRELSQWKTISVDDMTNLLTSFDELQPTEYRAFVVSVDDIGNVENDTSLPAPINYGTVPLLIAIQKRAVSATFENKFNLKFNLSGNLKRAIYYVANIKVTTLPKIVGSNATVDGLPLYANVTDKDKHIPKYERIRINDEDGEWTGTYKYQIIEPVVAASEGVYNPYSTASGAALNAAQLKYLSGSKLAAYNETGLQAYVIGDQLFVKSSTKTTDGGLTASHHWKRGTLPSAARAEESIYSNALMPELESILNQVISVTKDAIAAIFWPTTASDNSTQKFYRTVEAWINANPPIYPTVTGAGPLELKGIKFIDTQSGRMPEFQIIGDMSASENATVIDTSVIHPFVPITSTNGFTSIEIAEYGRYVMHYCSYALGDARFNEYASQGLESMRITDDKLIIRTKCDDFLSIDVGHLTCRDDIENTSNWRISSVDERYTFMGGHVKQPMQVRVRQNGDKVAQYTIPMYEREIPHKAFKITHEYYQNNLVVIGGYIQANDAANIVYRTAEPTGRETFMQFLPAKESWREDVIDQQDGQTYNLPTLKRPNGTYPKYPFAAYSTDGGLTFTTISTGGSKDDDLPIPVFNGETDYPNDFEVSSIFRRGNEIHIWYQKCTNPDAPEALGYLKLEVGARNSSLVLKAPEASTPIQQFFAVDDTDTTEVKLRKTVKSFTTNEDNVVLMTTNENNILIQAPLSITSTNSIVTSTSAEGKITVSGLSVDTESVPDEQLRVLASFLTNKSITNQAIFLENRDEYFDYKKDLIVPDRQEVESYDRANRLYSRREAMVDWDENDVPTDENDDKWIGSRREDNNGMPAISEDRGHAVYEYYEPYENEEGAIVYEYKPAINSAGEYVYYCDEIGRYLIERDTKMRYAAYKTYDLLRFGITVEQLFRAAKLREDYKLTIADEELMKLLNKTLVGKQKISYVDTGTTDPKLLFNSSSMETIVKSMLKYDTMLDDGGNTVYVVSSDYFGFWPTKTTVEGTSPNTTLKFEWSDETDLDLTPMNGDTLGHEDELDYWNYVWRIEETEGPFRSLDNTGDKDDRVGYVTFELDKPCVNIPNGAGKGGGTTIRLIYDMVYEFVVMKKEETFELSVFMPYLFVGNAQRFTQKPFEFNYQNKLVSPKTRYPITGVFLNPRGYGGTNLTNSWTYALPYDTDYLAFEDSLVSNTVDDRVYVVDARSNKIRSKRGLFYLKGNDQFDVTYDDLIDVETQIEVRREYSDTPDIYNIYKLPESKVKLAVPRTTCCAYGAGSDRSPKLSDLVNNEINELAYSKFTGQPSGGDIELLSVLSITKGGIPLDNVDNLSFEIVDSNNEQIVGMGITKKTSFVVDDTKFEPCYYIIYNTLDGLRDVATIIVKENDIVLDRLTITMELKPTDIRVISIKENLIDDQSNSLVSSESFIATIYFDKEEYLKTQLKSSTADVMINTKSIIEELSPRGDAGGVSIMNVILSAKSLNECSIFLSDKKFSLIVSKLNLVYAVKRKWHTNVIGDELKYACFSYDTPATDDGAIPDETNELFTISVDDEAQLIRFQSSHSTFTHTIPIAAPVDESLSFSTYYLKSGEYATIMNATPDELLLKNIVGAVLFVKPKYKSFKQLVDIHNLPIRLRNTTRLTKDLPSIVSTADLRNVSISKSIDLNGFNDGLNHDCLIRAKTVTSVELKSNDMNNDDFYIEVDSDTIYSYDRMFINPNVVPQVPIVINDRLYNSKNADFYYDKSTKFTNNAGRSVYACDENGKYVRYIVVNDESVAQTLPDDLTSYVNNSFDSRIVPLKPRDLTAYDVLYNGFYSDSYDYNPFWQTIKVRSTFDYAKKQFVYEFDIVSRNKELGKSVEYSVLTDDRYCSAKSAFSYSVSDNVLTIGDADVIDNETGVIRLLLSEPSQNYMTSTNLLKYAIIANNPLYPENSMGTVWTSSASFRALIAASYETNSTQDRSTKRDSSIVRMTEMGIFDQNHIMLLYAHFPPVEYRSDSQHVSFSVVINHDTLPVINDIDVIRRL